MAERTRPAAAFPQRFWAKVNKTPSCWLWTGCLHAKGYGEARNADGVKRKAHRIAYELLVGPIPDGLQLDHLCRVRACVNPAHLEPVTSRENTLRGDTIPAAHLAKTHCPAGHPYDQANTLYYRGWRRCRTCKNERERQSYARR